MTLTDEQKNNILRGVVSVKRVYSSDSIKQWSATLKSGVVIEVKTEVLYSERYYFVELCDGDDKFRLDDSEDLAEALIYQNLMDEKEAHLEEQRKERIRFESIIDSIGKDDTSTSSKCFVKTSEKVSEFEGESVSDTFWKRVWKSIVN